MDAASADAQVDKHQFRAFGGSRLRVFRWSRICGQPQANLVRAVAEQLARNDPGAQRLRVAQRVKGATAVCF